MLYRKGAVLLIYFLTLFIFSAGCNGRGGEEKFIPPCGYPVVTLEEELSGCRDYGAPACYFSRVLVGEGIMWCSESEEGELSPDCVEVLGGLYGNAISRTYGKWFPIVGLYLSACG